MSDPDPLMAKGTAILLANRAKSAGDLEEARTRMGGLEAELERLKREIEKQEPSVAQAG